MKKTILLIAIVVTALSSGCASLGRSDMAMVKELKKYGVDESDHVVKHPGTAGALNLLPGVGNFYLASGSGHGDQWTIGFLNLLTWPVSIIWGVPQASADATNINQLEMLYHYRFDREGKAFLSQQRKDAEGNTTAAD